MSPFRAARLVRRLPRHEGKTGKEWAHPVKGNRAILWRCPALVKQTVATIRGNNLRRGLQKLGRPVIIATPFHDSPDSSHRLLSLAPICGVLQEGDEARPE